MLGKRNMRDSVGYVTLGLFSNALLNELFEAKQETSIAPVRIEMITLAIESLENVSCENLPAGLASKLVFQDYQEVSTLRTTLSSSAINNVSGLSGILKTIINSEIDEPIRRTNIDNSILFFSTLAHSAIINAERTTEDAPLGVRHLA